MTFAPSQLDAIDRAFIAAGARPPHAVAATPPGVRTPAADDAAGRAALVRPPEDMTTRVGSWSTVGGDEDARGAGVSPRGMPCGGGRGDLTTERRAADRGATAPTDVVERLLRVAPAEWERVALRIERARRAGAEVIAVTGARRGEGRTTVVACLARVLSERGWRVECTREVPFALESAGGDDRRLVLVDAGVWFPAGPIRRAWLMRQALGCPAVLLVRSAGQPECPARGAALESLGMDVLGEVVTRVPARPAPADRE